MNTGRFYRQDNNIINTYLSVSVYIKLTRDCLREFTGTLLKRHEWSF